MVNVQLYKLFREEERTNKKYRNHRTRSQIQLNTTMSMTLSFIEYLCGPWVSRDCVFSEFGNSTFILSTIEYDYVACFCDHCIQEKKR